jgi:hypothetical protein
VFGDEVACRYVRRGLAQLVSVWNDYRERYISIPDSGAIDGKTVL